MFRCLLTETYNPASLRASQRGKMNRETIYKKLTSKGNEFVNLEEIQRVMGCGDKTARLFTNGLDYWKIGRTKHYDAEEVAGNISHYLKKGERV